MEKSRGRFTVFTLIPFRFSILARALIATSLLIWSRTANAEETCTNWNNFSIRLIISETNLLDGAKAPASIAVSNVIDNFQFLHWSAGDPCDCGFGRLLIKNLATDTEIPCRLTLNARAGAANYYTTPLYGHTSKSFDFDIAKTYALTNSGVYSVQAIARFPIDESSTNRQISKVVTPPIFVSFSTGSETNVPAK